MFATPQPSSSHVLSGRHVVASFLVAAALVGLAWQAQRVFGRSLLPHAFCLSASSPLLLVHLLSDSLIALAYLLIPWALMRVLRLRRDLPFGWIAWTFGAFIVACGSTHLLDVVTLYLPVYWYSGVAKGFTAVVSLATAGLLYRATPDIVALPTTAELQRVNLALQDEVRARQAAEADLRQANARVEQLLQEARARARESDTVLERFFEEAPMALALLEADGRLLRGNTAFLKAADNAQDAVVDAGPNTLRDFIARAIALRVPVVDQRVLSANDPDSLQGWRCTVFRVDRMDGPALIGVAVLDIGESLRLEHERALAHAATLEALRRMEDERAQFHELANNISQLAWMADPSGAIHWYNQRWYEFTGGTPEDMSGWGWRAVHHPDHLARVEARFLECISSGTPWDDTFPLRRHDGTWRWFLSRAFPLRNASGAVLRWFGTNTDITEQLEAQDALRQAAQRKDEFIAMLAHELRNPLAPVQSAAMVLRRSQSFDARGTTMLDIIERQVRHMGRLLNDLLDTARISRDVLLLQRESADLVEIAHATLESFRPLFAESGTEVVWNPGDGALPVDADVARITQAIGNVLHNASRFARGTRVTVSCFRDDITSQAVVQVRDEGRGIAPDLLPHLFESFSQERQNLARTEGGLGLGLSLSRRLADLHGGGVTLASEGEGHGTIVEVRIPLIQTNDRA